MPLGTHPQKINPTNFTVTWYFVALLNSEYWIDVNHVSYAFSRSPEDKSHDFLCHHMTECCGFQQNVTAIVIG